MHTFEELSDHGERYFFGGDYLTLPLATLQRFRSRL
jgi:hypothetical protein